MERRFFISEVPELTQGWKLTLSSITESELKRRLAKIAPQDLTYHDGANAVTDEDIDILLHGNA